MEVSVVVIGYNSEKYILKCINSLQKQKFNSYEIIYVDDGSTDKSLTIINDLMKQDQKIKLISQHNQGIVAARKNGLKGSEGKYIIFVDSDDWVHEDLINNLYENIKKNNNLDIVIADYIKTISVKKIYNNNNKCSFNKIYKDYEYLQLLLNQKIVHNMFSKIYRKDFLIKSNYLGLENVSMGEDLLTQVLLAVNKPNVLFIDEYLYYYYQNEESFSRNNSTKIFELVKVLDLCEQYLLKFELLDKYSKDVDFLWFLLCYYYYVVIPTKRKYNHKKFFYDYWMKKKIKIYANSLCTAYINNINFSNKILLYAYNFNFLAGFVLNKLVILIKTVKNWRKNE